MMWLSLVKCRSLIARAFFLSTMLEDACLSQEWQHPSSWVVQHAVQFHYGFCRSAQDQHTALCILLSVCFFYSVQCIQAGEVTNVFLRSWQHSCLKTLLAGLLSNQHFKIAQTFETSSTPPGLKLAAHTRSLWAAVTLPRPALKQPLECLRPRLLSPSHSTFCPQPSGAAHFLSGSQDWLLTGYKSHCYNFFLLLS